MMKTDRFGPFFLTLEKMPHFKIVLNETTNMGFSNTVKF